MSWVRRMCVSGNIYSDKASKSFGFDFKRISSDEDRLFFERAELYF